MAIPRTGRVLVARAAVALVAGLAVTFSANHSPLFGLIVFGIFAVLSGIAIVVFASAVSGDRALDVTQGIINCAAGSSALVFCSGSVEVYLFLVGSWAALVGFLEFYSGFRVRSRTVASRDATVIGGCGAVLALVFVLIPADSVLAIGLFGAYAVLLGTYSMIAGLSILWNTVTTCESAPPRVGVLCQPGDEKS